MQIIGRVVKVTDVQFDYDEAIDGWWEKFNLIIKNPANCMYAFEVFGKEKEVSAIAALPPNALVEVNYFISCWEEENKWCTRLKAETVRRLS